jgi:hypothetical protein
MMCNQRNKKDLIIFKNKKLILILLFNESNTLFKVHFRNNNFFNETNFVKMAPFLLIHGKIMISNIIKPLLII